MTQRARKTSFICGIAAACLVLGSPLKARVSEQRFVTLYLLNKLSAKKHQIKVPLGAAYIIQDIRIVPRSCEKIRDELYKIESDVAHVEIFVEQDYAEYKDQPGIHQPIMLYKGDLTNNTRLPSSPVEHPVYDLMLDTCD